MKTSLSGEMEDLAQVIGRNAAQLAFVEVSLGSVAHGFKIPFGGTLLSLNQGYFLTRLSRETKFHPSRRTLPFSVSCIVALLKSLSPAGNKLAPMLSISVQGLLFSLPLMVFDVSAKTLVLASALSSLWSFCQPLISFYILFGSDFFLALQALANKVLPFELSLLNSLMALAGVIAVKMLLASGLAVLAIRSERVSLLGGNRRVTEFAVVPVASVQAPWRQAVVDMMRPLFVGSFLITAIFLYYSESSQSQFVWKLLRPLAIAFLFFYLSRTFFITKLFRTLHGTRFEFLNRAHEVALERLGELAKRAV
jgi:hypothetical protein